MHDVQALTRFLLPPGWDTVCTTWMFGSHRRLVRRWECDTDLPKPGPFPQMSHTAAIVQAPQISGVGLGGLTNGRGRPAHPGPTEDTDCGGNHQNGHPRCRPLWLGSMGRFGPPAGGGHRQPSRVSPGYAGAHRAPAPGGDRRGTEAQRRWVPLATSWTTQDRVLDAMTLRDWAH